MTDRVHSEQIAEGAFFLIDPRAFRLTTVSLTVLEQGLLSNAIVTMPPTPAP